MKGGGLRFSEGCRWRGVRMGILSKKRPETQEERTSIVKGEGKEKRRRERMDSNKSQCKRGIQHGNAKKTKKK